MLDDLLGEIGDVTTGNLGSLCISQQFRSVAVPVRVDGFEAARQKADMLARLLQDLGQLDNQGMSLSLSLYSITYTGLAGRRALNSFKRLVRHRIESTRSPWQHCNSYGEIKGRLYLFFLFSVRFHGRSRSIPIHPDPPDTHTHSDC